MRSNTFLLSALALGAMTIPSEAQCERARILPEGVGQPVGLGSAVAVDDGRLALATGDGEIWIYTVRDRHAYLDERIQGPRAALGFGTSLDLDGNLLVVGAPFEREGTAYVYEDQGGGFQRVARLQASPRTTGGQFGWSVATDDGRIAVGEPFAGTSTQRRGAVTIFEEQGGTWRSSARLLGESTREDDNFGYALSLDGDRLAVGAPALALGAVRGRSGAVFVYDFTGAIWFQSGRLAPAGAQPGDGVGSAVALRGDTLVLGAEQANQAQGGLFLFENQAGFWSESAELAGPGGTLSGFGSSVALSEDGQTVAAGVAGASQDTGQVLIYGPGNPTWTLNRRLAASDPQADAFFGVALDMDGTDLVVGARAANGARLDAGAAYLFDTSGEMCRSLEASPRTVSLARGGLQTLFLNAGPEHAGASYVLAGSASGESPGSLLAGTLVPLNSGPYATLSVDPGNTWITNQTGTLDAQGRAVALLNVPVGGLNSVAGQVLHHAFILQDGGGTSHVSNVVRLELRP